MIEDLSLMENQMRNQHPLLARAQKYPQRDMDPSPAGCAYDGVVGAWRVLETGELWVDSPSRVGPKTKKHDIETGEDHKGE